VREQNELSCQFIVCGMRREGDEGIDDAAEEHDEEGARRRDTDAALISFPARPGGMGFFSHAQVAPHARAAMAEPTDILLKEDFAYFFPDADAMDSDAEDNVEPEPSSQHERCEKAFVIRRE
jgi:hypothetical protein